MKVLASLVFAFLFLDAISLCSARDRPQFRIGLIKLKFRDGIDDQAIDAYLRQYGVERKSGFNYDPKQLFESPSSELILYRSSAVSEETKWRLIVVPLGSEDFWVKIFSTSSFVAQAKRVEDAGSRGPGDDDFSWLGIPPTKIDEAQIAADTFAVPGTATEIFPKIKSFFLKRYRELFKTQDAFEAPTKYPNFRRYEVANLRSQVTSKYWEYLVIDVVIVTNENTRNALELGLAVYGAYATGIPGSLKPDLGSFQGNLLQVDYKPQLTAFTERLRADLLAYLTVNNP